MIKKINRFCFVTLILALSACSHTQIADEKNYQKTGSTVSNDIVLSSGDEVEIKFAYTPEFNELQTIRSDGNLELLLVGEIYAAGKTPSQLRNELIELYSKHLSHPELAVMLRSSYSNRVYVAGAVNAPGVLELVGRKTVFEAITEVGGFDLDSAKIKNVLLIRSAEGEKAIYTIDMKKYLSDKNQAPVYVKANDVIYVPKTKITNVANYMDKIWTIIPFRITTSYVFDTNDLEEIFE